MTPIERVLSKLDRVMETGNGRWSACCPAHEDRNPSLAVSVGDDGRVLLNCFAGCSPDAVRASLGLDWRDLHVEPVPDGSGVRRRPRAAPATPRDATPAGDPRDELDDVRAEYVRRLGEPHASWHYSDAGGETLGAVYRWNTSTGKTIRPAFRFPDGWRPSYPTVRPLYRLDTLADADRVFVAEGEKAAERLADLGFVATTSPAGSKVADRADWSPLTAREVVILPDADEPGEHYAAEVAGILSADPDRIVAVVRLHGIRPGSGEDVAEWIDAVHAGDESAARRALELAADQAIAGVRRTRPLLTAADILNDPAWSQPPDVLRSGAWWFDEVQPFGGLERGSLTVIAAPPRCYKTSLMLFLAWRFAESGRRVHYHAGEMTRRALLRRIVAMQAEVSPVVVSDPQELAMSRRVQDATERLAALGDRLAFGRAPITLDAIESSAGSADVVFVDYLQLVQPDREHAGTGRVDELDGTMRAMLAVTQAGGTVVAAAALNRVGRDAVSLSSIRGSSAIEYGATAVYATTEDLAGVDDERPPERVSVEYRCVKQREGVPRPLRFDLALPLGPLPLEPTL